ncbi:MAG TPA: hypothetical protein VIJ71_05035 [Mycobacteriales bacterium]
MKRDAEIAAQVAEAITIPDAEVADAPDRHGMDLLAAHVPLSLLLDLAQRRGPQSKQILKTEVPDEDELAWLSSAR